jgi:hypothetical protein
VVELEDIVIRFAAVNTWMQCQIRRKHLAIERLLPALVRVDPRHFAFAVRNVVPFVIRREALAAP